jgi:transglutaminase-like putative cysteine protease
MSVLEIARSVEMERRQSALSRLFPGRDAITIAIVLIITLSVVVPIDEAGWVEGMPSLYPIAIFGLATGYLLAKVPWRNVFVDPIALLCGAAGLLVQVLAITPGDNLRDRSGEMVLRMRLWFDALRNGGISSDALPVIVLILVLTWLATYFLAWSVFRWNNPWLGLVPGGLALLFNVSYLPGQTSPAFVVFVIAAVLLVSRAHFAGKMNEWRKTHTDYPGSLHFFSLSQTLWATLLLVGVAWLVPLGNRAPPLQSAWRGWSDPVANRFVGLGRVFSAVQGKKGMPLDRYASFLPYRGYFEAVQGVQGKIMTVKATQPFLLRATVYDVYTSTGWRAGKREREPLQTSGDDLATIMDEATSENRQPVAVQVTVDQPLPVFVTPGQPVTVDRQADAETGADRSDVTSLRPVKGLKSGDTYTAIGLVFNGYCGDSRRAGTDYPAWVTNRYLQLPDDLPDSVRTAAEELVGEAGTPCDAAENIQWALRGYPIEAAESAPPSDVDAVQYFLEKGSGDPLLHATAMVVMLRTLGVPARLAVGFAMPQEMSLPDSAYHVYGTNALAWPEVYFPSYGWIPFSPSWGFPSGAVLPESPDSAIGPQGPLSKQDLIDMFPRASTGNAATPEVGSVSAQAQSGDRGRNMSWFLIPVVAVAALALASFGGMRYAWNRGLGGLSTPAQLFEKTRRLSSWSAAGPSPSRTPREFLGGLREEFPDGPDLSLLATAYERVEFGRKLLQSEDEARLNALWRDLRPRLLRRILRRRAGIGGRE